MRLEYAGDLSSREHFPNGADRAAQFCGMVGVVIDIAYAFPVHVYVKTAHRTLEAADCVANLLSVNAVAQAYRRCSNAVLHVHPTYGAHAYVAQDTARVHEVIGVATLSVEAEVASVEVCQSIVIMVGVDSGPGDAAADRKTVLQNQGFADLGCELAEGVAHVLQVSVYVQMVGVHRCYCGNCRVQLEEGTVEFVGFGYHCPGFAHKHIGAVVLRDASEESGATVAALGEYVGYQRGGGGLTVRAGYSEAGFPFAEFSEHTGALDHPVAFFTCVRKFPETVGNGGGVNHKRIPDIRGKA